MHTQLYLFLRVGFGITVVRSVIELTPTSITRVTVASGSSMALFERTKQVRPRRSMGNTQTTPSAAPEEPEQGLGVKSPPRK